MRYTRLTKQDSPTLPQLAYHLTLHPLLLPGPGFAFKGADPTYIAHGGFDVFDVKLVFEADREAVERADCVVVLGIVGVEGFCRGDGGVEEDFVEAVELRALAIPS